MSKVLTIQRSKWYRGQGSDESYLLNCAGQMCCLGFDALARGLSAEDIEIAGDPSGVSFAPEFYKEAMLVENIKNGWLECNDAVTKAIEHNDDPGIADAEREVLIREDLKALGWDDVLFVD
jgi:hypothetical protein